MMWAKITGFLGLVISILLALIGYKNKQIDDLEDENESLVKSGEIADKQDKANIEAEKNEDEARKDFDDSIWRDNI